MRAAGPRVLWIVCGRDDLSRSRQFGDEHFKGYADDWPRRRTLRNMSQLARDDVQKYFELEAPNHPITEAEVEAVSHGEPLRTLCRDPNMPSRSTVQAWANRRRDVARAVDLGRDNAAWLEADRRLDHLGGRAGFQRWMAEGSTRDPRK